MTYFLHVPISNPQFYQDKDLTNYVKIRSSLKFLHAWYTANITMARVQRALFQIPEKLCDRYQRNCEIAGLSSRLPWRSNVIYMYETFGNGLVYSLTRFWFTILWRWNNYLQNNGEAQFCSDDIDFVKI